MNKTKRDPEKMAILADMAPRVKTVASIARKLGVSAPTVVVWAREAGIALPQGRPPTREMPVTRLYAVELPPWVPAHLQDEFWRVVEVSGEHEACARVRQLKAAERAFTTAGAAQAASGGGRRVMGMAAFGR